MVKTVDNDELDDLLLDEDENENEEQYAKLQASVAQMDSSQRVRSAKRNELGSLISEYHVTRKDSKSIVAAHELANVLGPKKKLSKITKAVKKVSDNSKTLPTRLEKPVEEKIKRKIGFEIVKEQLGGWDAVVESRRVADHLEYPVNEAKVGVISGGDIFNKFVTTSTLEKELNAVLHGEQPEQNKEEVDEFPLTLEEMIERRKELAGIRAKQSYREAKAFRQSKIKSKKYHRIQKKQNIRNALKEFEVLQKTDPEAALQKLEELEKSRAEERATLRHRSTGKWAKNLTVRAKYDKDSRKVLAEQLSISRDKTMKAKTVDSSDDEGEPNPTVLKSALEIAKSNPWSLDVSSEVNSFITGFRKYWNDKNGKQTKKNETSIIEEPEPVQQASKKRSGSLNKEDRQNKKIKLGASDKWAITPVVADSRPIRRKVGELDMDDAFYLADQKLAYNISKKFKILKGKIKAAPAKLKKQHKKDQVALSLKMKKSRWHVERAQVDEELVDVNLEDKETPVAHRSPVTTTTDNPVVNPSQINIDPDVFLKVKPKIVNTPLAEDVAGGDDEVLDDDEQQQVIMEAFADDNVTDFKKAKEDANKESQPEVVAELPGWGSWGGTGIAPSKRRRRRFLKIPNLPSRKDKHLPDVIINEEANPNVVNHMVKEVPFPFKSVAAFESNIRAPLSREWVPELAHRDLIHPAVITRQGTIIEPMSDDVLIRNRPKPRSVYSAKSKKPIK